MIRKIVKSRIPYALLMAGCLLALGLTLRAAEDQTAQVSKLLSDAKVQAVQLREDAGELWLLTQVPPSASSAAQIRPETHAEAIHKISADVSAMTVQLEKLENARKGAAPWQQNAIDSIKPLIREMVTSTTTLVEYIDKNPTRTTTDVYKEYVEANADRANQLATLIMTYVDYGKTKDRLERIGGKLGLPNATK